MTLTRPSDRELQLTRVFDAPRRLVFEAHTTCEHLRQWWGPSRFSVSSCEMDFRPGGAWRFVQRGSDGQEYGFRGVYREIVPPDLIVRTFEFEGMPGHVSLETLTLVERDGQTTLTSRSLFDSKEDRDGMLQSGMEAGAAETMDRLAEYLENRMSVPARDVDAYIAAAPKGARLALAQLRQTIRAAAPKASEVISYQIPTYRHHGHLVGFAALRDHCTFHVMSPSVMRAHAAQLKAYKVGRASIRFPADQPLPAALVKKLVKARIAENERRSRTAP
ncbi:MAG: SRPBCC domain-containing protein [Gemmatimonadales bacterium]